MYTGSSPIGERASRYHVLQVKSYIFKRKPYFKPCLDLQPDIHSDALYPCYIQRFFL